MITASATPAPVTNHIEFWSAARRRLVPALEQVRLRDLLHVMGSDPVETAVTPLSALVPVWCLRKDAALYHEGSAADVLYIVRSGSFKCVKSSEDGYQQVQSFFGVGEVLGFDSLHRGRYRTTAFALEVSTVFAVSLQDWDAWRQNCPPFDQALQRAISRQLDAASDMAELMAAVSADARLARFLLWMSDRMAAAGQSAHCLHLRMWRRDIASLLGVAHETVSRSFTNLADEGLVQVLNRDVDILDLEGLRLRARCTRGASDDRGEPKPRVSPAKPGAARPRVAADPAFPPRSWMPDTDFVTRKSA
ncbi:MAG: Crp/Fnr family transcriptional regulator [Leptothrix sp. (in: b-proteobacteria)]